MRARLVLLGVIVVVGCTRDNPAFETGSGGSETLTSAEGEEAESEEADTGQDGTEPLCPLQPRDSMFVKLAQAPTCGGDTPEVYEEWFQVVESVDEHTVTVATGCMPGCPVDSCTDTFPPQLTLEPLPLSTLAPATSCLHVRAGRLPPQNPESCQFEVVTVEKWEPQLQVPIPIISLRNAVGATLPVDNLVNAPDFASFDPAPTDIAASCECDEYPGACCEDRMTATYVFDHEHLPESVAPGALPVTVHLDDRDYSFWAYNAFQPGACEEPMQVSWALTLQEGGSP